MAWQGQKDVFTSYYPHMAINVDVWNIVHSGTTLTYNATVRVIVTSGNIYCSSVTASISGGGSQSKAMNPVSTSGYVDFGTFYCTVNNVPATSTTYELTASMSSSCRSSGGSGPYISGSNKWVISIGSGGTAPSGASIAYNSCTWNSVTATTSVTSTGGATCIYGLAVVTGTYNGAADSITGYAGEGRKWVVNSGGQTVISDSTYTGSADSPIAIKGLLHYKLGLNVENSVGNATAFDNTLRYLPPAPSQFSYGTPTGSTNLTYPVTFTGVAANNHTTYDSASLTRTIRYKIGSGNWTYVDNATVAAIDFVTNFSVTVPAGQVATIEGWQTYHGMDSAVETITISNTNAPVALYGSVGGEAKKLGPVYASVNGRTKKLTKIYASVGGVTKKVYEDV